MSEVRLDWLKGKTFVGTDSTRHAIVLSSSDEANGTGMKPSDLLLLGLASCASVDVVEILNKKRQAPEGMEVRVEGIQETEPPWTFRRIHMRFLLRGQNLQPTAVEQAIRLAQEKYCSVAATIRCAAEITTSFEIQPPPKQAA
jgi:putative redox protein